MMNPDHFHDQSKSVVLALSLYYFRVLHLNRRHIGPLGGADLLDTV